MAAALVASIIACVLLATTVGAIVPAPELAVTTAPDVDCSPDTIELTQVRMARMQRSLARERSPRGELGEWFAAEIAAARSVLTNCGVNTDLGPCFDLEEKFRVLERARARQGSRERALHSFVPVKRELERCEATYRR